MGVVVEDYFGDILYADSKNKEGIYDNDIGYWTFFFRSKKEADFVAREAIQRGVSHMVVVENKEEGQIMIYGNATNKNMLVQILLFAIDIKIARYTEGSGYPDYYFTLENPKHNGEFGTDSNGWNTASQFINIKTGKPL